MSERWVLSSLVIVWCVGCSSEPGAQLADAGSVADAIQGADGSAMSDARTQDAVTAGDAGDGVPSGMVLVPAGPFLMGCDSCADVDEAPQHEVQLSTYAIDATEVTQGAYGECITAGACVAPWGNFDWSTPTHPVNSLSWLQAQNYCAWRAKRLPTEAEWEKAARGTDGRQFPWGDEALDDCTHAVTDSCGGHALPVGSLPAGASPYGALDMAGNVWEMVEDYYAEDAYASHSGPDPQGPATGTYRVYRGGSAGNFITLARTSNRASAYNPEIGGSGLGFRCALSVSDID